MPKSNVKQLPVENDLMPKGHTVVPNKGKVAIIRDKTEEKIGNIWVPDNVKEKNPPLSGTIAAVGEGVDNLHPNDYVVFGQYSGTNVRVNEKIYIIMKAEDVHAVIS